MKGPTKSTLRLISVILVVVLILMEINIIPDVINFRFWFMVGAYGLVMITLTK